VLYSSTIERIVIETANNWFVEVVQDSIKQVLAAFSTRHSSISQCKLHLTHHTNQKKPCLEVLKVVDSSVQTLRDISDSKHFCQKVTQAKMLALLKKTFIEPVEAGGVALRDRILSMEDGFESLLNTRSAEASLSGLSQMYNLCTGRVFSTTFESDPDFVAKLAEVSSLYTSYPYYALYGDDDIMLDCILSVVSLECDTSSYSALPHICFQEQQKQTLFPILTLHQPPKKVVSTCSTTRSKLKPLWALRIRKLFPMNQKHTWHSCTAKGSLESCRP
jgi:hypothetical protein